jgi:hypothetical protein
VLESGKGARQNVRITSQGRSMLLNITVEPLRDSAGTVIGITCASLEITGQEGADANTKSRCWSKMIATPQNKPG